MELKLTSKNVPELAFQNEVVCARDGERMSADVGFLDTHSKTCPSKFWFYQSMRYGQVCFTPYLCY